MPTPIRDLILDAMVARMLTIKPANGYSRTVRACSRVIEVPENIKQWDAVYIIERGDVLRRHIKAATEVRAQLEFAAFTREFFEDAKTDGISRLMADVKKAIYVDETWGQRAVKTNPKEALTFINQVAQPLAVNRITVEVLWREVRGNPYAVREFN